MPLRDRFDPSQHRTELQLMNDQTSSSAGAGQPSRPFRLFRAMVYWYLAAVVFWTAALIATSLADEKGPGVVAFVLAAIPFVGSLFIIFRRRYWKWFLGSWLTSAACCLLLG